MKLATISDYHNYNIMVIVLKPQQSLVSPLPVNDFKSSTAFT